MFVPGELSMQSAFTSVQPSYSTLFTQGAFIPLQPENLASVS